MSSSCKLFGQRCFRTVELQALQPAGTQTASLSAVIRGMAASSALPALLRTHLPGILPFFFLGLVSPEHS